MRMRTAGSLAALTLAAVTGLSMAGVASAAPPPSPGPNLGPNVVVFDPTMTVGEIQAAVDAVAAQQVDNEMGTQRYSLLFKPGTYGSAAQPLIIQVGYYTEVAGLGASPGDVTINGHVDVYNRCLAPDNCIALNNFWRSVTNLTVNVMGLDGCRSSGNFWAVSQAAPMRRVSITGGNLTLMDYCTAGPQYASGGFIADSSTGFVINGSQQQFVVRNSSIGGWSNGVWNQVFAGVLGAPAQSFASTPYNPPPYTTLDTNPVSREKPYLYVDSAGDWRVFVPAARTQTAGTTWGSSPTPGRSIALSAFYLARPSDSVQTINKELAQGKNLIFTPGVYNIGSTIKVKRADTVVLGLGLATLTAANGVTPVSVGDVKGVVIAGLMIDAGPVSSPVLLQVGTQRAAGGQAGDRNAWSDPADPTALQDVFFRVGGPHVGKATVSLQVNSDHVVLDDVWAWRADHGTGVGWAANTADTGLVVNGDHVAATGLFVEHYQRHEVVWNGEYGQTIFFQNEMPYDVPDQASWRSSPTSDGYPAILVAPGVQHFSGIGMGSYSFFDQGVDIHAARAFEVPDSPGVKLSDVLTVFLNGSGGIDHVVNDIGAAVNASNQVTNLVSYP